MTREKMRELQSQPRNPKRHFRVSRPKSMQAAQDAGAKLVDEKGLDPRTGWWPELARLTPTPAERATVRATLAEALDATKGEVR